MALACRAVDLAESEAFRDSADGGSAAPVRSNARLHADQASRQQRALAKFISARTFVESDKEPCQILQGLYIGSMGAARNRASLKRLGVHGIVNASPVVPCFHRSCFQYKTVTIYDDAEEDISQHFHTTNQFITEARKAGGALVHCYAGRSRSATLVLAYLVACEGMSLQDAYAVLLAARPCASPNVGFRRQLNDFTSCLQRPMQK